MYPDSGYKMTHAQSVCTGPFSRGRGLGTRLGSGVLRAISWASRMQNSHVILIIVMATHCRVCGSRMQQRCGLICAASALSHKNHMP